LSVVVIAVVVVVVVAALASGSLALTFGLSVWLGTFWHHSIAVVEIEFSSTKLYSTGQDRTGLTAVGGPRIIRMPVQISLTTS
jgi:hypothetical protein